MTSTTATIAYSSVIIVYSETEGARLCVHFAPRALARRGSGLWRWFEHKLIIHQRILRSEIKIVGMVDISIDLSVPGRPEGSRACLHHVGGACQHCTAGRDEQQQRAARHAATLPTC